MEQVSQRICRKCLLRDMADEAYENVSAYVRNLPPDDRVPDAVYEERLGGCRGCAMLLAGMCRLCGCYVELRAAMKVRGCPAVPPKWEPYREQKYH